MQILILGGIFGAPGYLQYTPETLLAEGLRARGHSVFCSAEFNAGLCDAVDVVHAHHVIPASVHASAQGRTPVVFTSHTGPALQGTLDRSRTLALREIVRSASGLVALHDADARLFARLGAGSKPVVIIPNGIPTIETRDEGKRSGMLYVGQLSRAKGVFDLIEALALLPPDHPASSLTIASQYAPDEAEFWRRASLLGVRHRIRFLGARDPQAVRKLMRSSLLVVLPSYAESLPSVISEAFLCGTPVVATNVGGISEQFDNSGWQQAIAPLVSPGQPDQLARAIDGVSMRRIDDDERQRVRDIAKSRYDIDRMISSHVGLYERVVETGALRGARVGPRLVSRALTIAGSARRVAR